MRAPELRLGDEYHLAIVKSSNGRVHADCRILEGGSCVPPCLCLMM